VQAGVEFSDDTRQFVLGFQAQAPHHISTELVTLFDERGDGYLIAKAEHDFVLAERLVLWPRLEVIGASQDDEANATGRGLSAALADLRLRYEMRPRFIPYVGVSWGQALGDSASMLEAAGEDTSVVTLVAGASFAF
jgi:copper resistance protein B